MAEANFGILARMETQLSAVQAAHLYAAAQGSADFDALFHFMSSGPIVAFALARSDQLSWVGWVREAEVLMMSRVLHHNDRAPLHRVRGLQEAAAVPRVALAVGPDDVAQHRPASRRAVCAPGRG